MKVRTILLNCVFVSFIAVPVFAQDTPAPTAENDATTSPQPMTSMMEKCQARCKDTQREISSTTEAIKNAKNSNDVDTMRQALEKAESSLSEMSENMTQCLSMMDMMSNMHGMMGGERMQHQGMMGGEGMQHQGMMNTPVPTDDQQ